MSSSAFLRHATPASLPSSDAITAIVGLLIWDLLGLIFGLPLAVFGLVRGARSLDRTRAYPSDRRAAVTAIVAGLASLALVIPIWIGASN